MKLGLGLCLVAILALLPVGLVPQAQDAPATPKAPKKVERFSAPVQCNAGEDCWIIYYTDLDYTSGTQDYRCGPRSYDGLGGTVFALRDKAVMEKGVDVIAVVGGEVLGVRANMPDIDVNEVGGAIAIKGKECGNGVAIKHDDGLRTQYCHLKKDSVPVKKGDRVATGQKIGQVGMSGLSEFPNLEFLVTRDGVKLDPFAGETRSDPCGPGQPPLWTDETIKNFPYYASAIVNAGFAPAKPRDDGARDGLYQGEELSTLSPGIVLWADIFWVDEGDRLSFQIDAPDGTPLVRHSNVIPRTLVRKFAYAGKQRETAPWPPGTYKGSIILEKRDAQGDHDRIIIEKTVSVN